MKKLLSLVLLVLTLTSSLVIYSASDIKVTVNGNVVAFPDAKPYIENGRTMVPVRFIAENLGCKVDWNGQLRVVYIKKSEKAIELKIGASEAILNGQVINLDTKAIIKQSRTFVPLRFVSEALGANVEWDGATRTVIITTSTEAESTPTPTPIATPSPSSISYDPSKWVTVSENGEDYELSINIDWNISEKFRANCDYAESVISGKYNSDIAKQVVDIARSKTERRDMFRKTLQNDGKQIDIISSGTSISILFWKEGVNP